MIRSSLRPALFLAALALAGVARASAFTGADLLIPIAGRTTGAYGTRWQTDLFISNNSRSAIEPFVVVFRRDGHPDALFSSTLQPRATLVLRDAVRETFGLEHAVGTIRILAASDIARLSARARIYNTGSSNGEFGQIVQAMPPATLPREAVLAGISGLGPNRTNVGIANAETDLAVAVLTLLDRDGRMLRGILVEVPAGGSLVLNDVFSHFGGEPLDEATIHIVASRRFYAWASIVRDDSGDADFVAASGLDR